MGTSVEDWQVLFDLVQTRDWQWQYSEGLTELPLPLADAVLARPADSEIAELRVWPVPGVLAIFLSGMFLMAYNTWRTVRASQPADVVAAAQMA